MLVACSSRLKCTINSERLSCSHFCGWDWRLPLTFPTEDRFDRWRQLHVWSLELSLWEGFSYAWVRENQDRKGCRQVHGIVSQGDNCSYSSSMSKIPGRRSPGGLILTSAIDVSSLRRIIVCLAPRKSVITLEIWSMFLSFLCLDQFCYHVADKRCHLRLMRFCQAGQISDANINFTLAYRSNRS